MVVDVGRMAFCLLSDWFIGSGSKVLVGGMRKVGRESLGQLKDAEAYVFGDSWRERWSGGIESAGSNRGRYENEEDEEEEEEEGTINMY